METASLLWKYVWPTMEPQTQTVLTYMHVNIECRDNDEHLPEVLRIVLGLHLT